MKYECNMSQIWRQIPNKGIHYSKKTFKINLNYETMNNFETESKKEYFLHTFAFKHIQKFIYITVLNKSKFKEDTLHKIW